MKRGQFNFVWLFAIIVGGAILFLAIYGASRTADTARYESDTKIVKELSFITNPLESGFSAGSFGKISFKKETRINNICFENDNLFGKQDISVATRSEIGEEWNDAGGATSIYNKYIFSDEKNQGEDYYIFSKPFNFPYKVADILIITTRNYCFQNAPDEISEEMTELKMPNIFTEDCADKNFIDVCFSGSGCDINVYTNKVVKGNSDLLYAGKTLMYAAIFSEKGVYDCNVKRLLYKTGQIAEILAQKTDLLNARGCSTNLGGDLSFWSASTTNADSSNLMVLEAAAENLEARNDREVCNVWE